MWGGVEVGVASSRPDPGLATAADGGSLCSVESDCEGAGAAFSVSD